MCKKEKKQLCIAGIVHLPIGSEAWWDGNTAKN